jgi:hypothetical protein
MGVDGPWQSGDWEGARRPQFATYSIILHLNVRSIPISPKTIPRMYTLTAWTYLYLPGRTRLNTDICISPLRVQDFGQGLAAACSPVDSE